MNAADVLYKISERYQAIVASAVSNIDVLLEGSDTVTEHQRGFHEGYRAAMHDFTGAFNEIVKEWVDGR